MQKLKVIMQVSVMANLKPYESLKRVTTVITLINNLMYTDERN
jgi:hypothetical protein